MLSKRSSCKYFVYATNVEIYFVSFNSLLLILYILKFVNGYPILDFCFPYIVTVFNKHTLHSKISFAFLYSVLQCKYRACFTIWNFFSTKKFIYIYFFNCNLLNFHCISCKLLLPKIIHSFGGKINNLAIFLIFQLGTIFF